MSRSSENNIQNLLKRWLSGDSNRQEEKQLEALAKEDAFLAEAMEGYRQFPEGQHEERLAQLRSRLGKREEEKRPLMFYLSRVAAVVLFLVVAGIGILTLLPADESSEIGMEESITKSSTAPAEAPIPETTLETAPLAENAESKALEVEDTAGAPTLNDAPQANASAPNLAAPTKPESVPPKKEALSSNFAEYSPSPPVEADDIVVEDPIAYSTAPVQQDSIQIIDIQDAATDYYVDGIAVNTDIQPTNSPLDTPSAPAVIAADAPSAANSVREEKLAYDKEILQEADDPVLKRKQESRAKKKDKVADAVLEVRAINGSVVDAGNNEPIAFATIVVDGTQNGTASDIDGKFSLEVTSEDQRIIVSFVGYQDAVVDLGQDKQFDIALYSKRELLEEVAVTGYSVKEEKAKPEKGWRKFRKYLKKNRVYPAAAQAAGIQGEVIVEFLIGSEGRPEQFIILQSLGYGCDEEAIRLIREGPDWKGEGIVVKQTISFGQ